VGPAKFQIQEEENVMKWINKHSVAVFLVVGLGLCVVPSVNAQCQGKNGFALAVCQAAAARRAPGKTGGGNAGAPAPEPTRPPALTTGLADAIHLSTLPPSVEAAGFAPLTSQQRRDDGAFVLRPGLWELSVESYSLEPGDAGNRAGAAFFAAPIKGSRARVIAAVLKNAELHPEIPRADMQSALWAINGGASFQKMAPAVQKTVAVLLTPELLGDLKQPAAPGVPATTFLAPGTALVRGVWAGMAGGWWIRLLPDGTSKVRIQLIVPDGATEESNPPVFDVPAFLGVYMGAPQMRLGLTMRPAR
jgi:hypothetical protein